MEHIKESTIPGLFQISLPTYGDERGFFKEVLRIENLNKKTQTVFNTQQFNHARSQKNILRGIHIAPWIKIVYVTHGLVQAVIVDTRKDSAAFGKYESFILGEENKTALFIPENCGNSYLVLSDIADYLYLTDKTWYPNSEKSIAWNDQDLNIQWLLNSSEPILSEKDKNNPPFSSLKQ